MGVAQAQRVEDLEMSESRGFLDELRRRGVVRAGLTGRPRSSVQKGLSRLPFTAVARKAR